MITWWSCDGHGLFVIKSALHAFHLDSQLIDTMLLRGDLVLKLCLCAIQVSQLSLIPCDNLLLVF